MGLHLGRTHGGVHITQQLRSEMCAEFLESVNICLKYFNMFIESNFRIYNDEAQTFILFVDTCDGSSCAMTNMNNFYSRVRHITTIYPQVNK